MTDSDKMVGKVCLLGIHEIFFSEFPVVLYEWLARLVTQNTNCQGGEPKEWTPQLIQRLESVSNYISKDVNFWVDKILGGYITEIVVDTINSYSEAERELFQGHRGR